MDLDEIIGRCRTEWKAILRGDLCSYCGSRHAMMTIDHIEPKSRGHTLHDNAAAACFVCNQLKDDERLLRFLSAWPVGASRASQYPAIRLGRGVAQSAHDVLGSNPSVNWWRSLALQCFTHPASTLLKASREGRKTQRTGLWTVALAVGRSPIAVEFKAEVLFWGERFEHAHITRIRKVKDR